MRIVAVSGSLRRRSYNTSLLRAAAELAPGDVEISLLERDLIAAIPPYDADVEGEGAPASVIELKRRIAEADAVLFATPEYNSSVPGQLKNALDWVSRPMAENPLRGKPVLVVGASASAYGAVWAQAELRKVLGILGARNVDAEVAVSHAPARFDEDGRLEDPVVREQLADALADLVAETTAASVAVAA